MEYRVRALNKTGSINAKHNSRIKPRQTSKVSRQRQAWNMTGTRNTWEKIGMQKIWGKDTEASSALKCWHYCCGLVIFCYQFCTSEHHVNQWKFWFRLLPLMCILSILMGREGQHAWRTWREEEVRWSSGQDPVRLSLPRSRLSSLQRRAHVSLTLWVLFSLIWFDFVGFSKLLFLFRSLSLCFFCWTHLLALCPLPSPEVWPVVAAGTPLSWS